MMYQIVTIYYEYIYKKEMIHRDIKPDNILFNRLEKGGYLFKIGDFGLIKSKRADKHTNGFGTMRYMSPEQFEGDGHYSSKTDVFPMGYVFFGLLMGKYPDDIISDVDVTI